MLLHWKFRYLIIFCQGAFANFLNVITAFQKQKEIPLLLQGGGYAPPKTMWLEYLESATSLWCSFSFPQSATCALLSVPAEVSWNPGAEKRNPAWHTFKPLKHSNKMITKAIVVIKVKGSSHWVIVNYHWRLQQWLAFTVFGKDWRTFW